ncbi:hypothetical protein [Streptomyces sp. NPDC001492]
MNLSGYFASRFGCQVNAENDATLATVAEHGRGCARHIDDVVGILAGPAHRCRDDRRRTAAPGPNGAAGEIGNLRLLGWCDAPGGLEAHGADAEAVLSAAPSSAWKQPPRSNRR